MNVAQAAALLKEWAEQEDLKEAALRSCREALQNAFESERERGTEPLGGIKLEELILEFHSNVLVFEHYLKEYPYIETHIWIYINDTAGIWFRRMKPVGEYRLLATLDGNIIDDSLEYALNFP